MSLRDDYDTRNPLAIAAWAADELAWVCSLDWSAHAYAVAERAGRVAILEELLRGILGTDDLQKIMERGDVPLQPVTRRRIGELYGPAVDPAV